MKIEVGESLCYSYLRHVKRCWLVQTNWKSSEHWATRKTVKELEEMFQDMRQEFDPDGTVLKQTANVSQFMQQGEIDVIGVDQDGNIHALDVAFHEAGLNYSGEVANRVLKKVLRAYLLLIAYHPAATNCHILLCFSKGSPSSASAVRESICGIEGEIPGNRLASIHQRWFFRKCVGRNASKSGHCRGHFRAFRALGQIAQSVRQFGSERTKWQ